MRALFISDLHLSESDALTHARFIAFARGPARTAQRLYILGDLFHQWLGDAQIDHDDYAASVVEELRAITDSGVDIRLLVGNRDFMIGQPFATRIGATLLKGPVVETIDSQAVLLLHGDELCTDDIQYQRARRVLRHPLFRLAVAPLPFFVRKRIAQYLRRKSGQHVRKQSAAIMDVTESAVIAAFQRYQCTRMIHGHTHRPTGAVGHSHDINGSTATRIVLDDWQEGSGYSILIDGVVSHHPWPR